jgi:urease accessory protein
MLTLTSVVARGERALETGTLTLPFDQRRRARLRARLDDGTEVALLLPRGLALRDGDRLRSEDGAAVVRIVAATEELSCVRAADPHLLLRAAYHLGNRHVALQVEPERLLYQHDHVLDGLARELGLEVSVLKAPFEPETGGYGRDEHGHAHGHGHDHHQH